MPYNAMFYQKPAMNCRAWAAHPGSQVADNAEDQVPFRAWLFRGNPMPRKKLGVATTSSSIPWHLSKHLKEVFRILGILQNDMTKHDKT